MRRKTLGGVRAATSTKSSHPTFRAIPLLVSQDEDDAAVPKTSNESLGHDYVCIDVLDRKICISCNEGGEVLVCSERGCPVTVHAKCICCEPKFDDMGNFYCSYCWLKRALAEVQELRNKALIAKKDLLNFLDNNMITNNKLVQKNGEANRKDPKELSLVGNGSCLDYRGRQGNDCVHRQPLQRMEDQQKEMEGVSASADQQRIAVEDETHANALVANTGDSMHYRKERAPGHIELAHKSIIGEKFDVHNISETHETRFVEGKEWIKPEYSRYNGENVQEGIVEDEEEAKPLSSSHLGKYTDGHSPDISFVKGTQESVAVSVDNKDPMQDREKLLQNELKMPATGSSVSETNDSDSEALLVKKRHVKQMAPKYPQRVSSVRKSLPLNRNAEGENGHHENEEVTSSRTLRQARVSSKQGKKLTVSTGKRKRLRWTTEEENTLKEGVLRFSKENRNIPWGKILEFGCQVFDNTRTPVDLKDKWRTIMAKEGYKLRPGSVTKSD